MRSIFENTGFMNDSGKLGTSSQANAQCETNSLLAFLFDKHTAEYNQYKFKLAIERERVLQEELAKQKAAEEEAKRFNLDKAVDYAVYVLKHEIDKIVKKYNYTKSPHSGFGYTFYCNLERYSFNTLEFSESFSNVTGLSFDRNPYSATYATVTGTTMYDHFPIMETLVELKDRVVKLESKEKSVCVTERLPIHMKIIDWILTTSLYGPK